MVVCCQLFSSFFLLFLGCTVSTPSSSRLSILDWRLSLSRLQNLELVSGLKSENMHRGGTTKTLETISHPFSWRRWHCWWREGGRIQMVSQFAFKTWIFFASTAVWKSSCLFQLLSFLCLHELHSVWICYIIHCLEISLGFSFLDCCLFTSLWLHLLLHKPSAAWKSSCLFWLLYLLCMWVAFRVWICCCIHCCLEVDSCLFQLLLIFQCLDLHSEWICCHIHCCLEDISIACLFCVLSCIQSKSAGASTAAWKSSCFLSIACLFCALSCIQTESVVAIHCCLGVFLFVSVARLLCAFSCIQSEFWCIIHCMEII